MEGEEHDNEGSWLAYITAASVFVAAVALALMWPRPEYFYAALVAGTLSFGADFAVEYIGIKRGEWRYASKGPAVGKVPLLVPTLFFCLAIITAFWYYGFMTNPARSHVLDAAFSGLSPLQIFLSILGLLFLIQYFRGKVNNLTFGLLPLGVALYMAYPEPWLLALAIIPMYLDYFIEKFMLKKKAMEYADYDEELAASVAISYFAAALFLLGLFALMVDILA